ncbi:AAA domain-containing protein [Janibacter sp. DB-40]|uniref:AAA domain-containing protein n=1 Tax=Janibacter sp. DB-40 TaxID=3028808 RepID=UPI0024050B58|nr:AAA domain-containing protein [Janibacter sp. DB-40]
MTPFVVGQVLPLRERFDLVIVDDASRTTLARALSGIARGSQLLVIGDRGQLPPRVWSADGESPHRPRRSSRSPTSPPRSCRRRPCATAPTRARG